MGKLDRRGSLLRTLQISRLNYQWAASQKTNNIRSFFTIVCTVYHLANVHIKVFTFSYFTLYDIQYTFGCVTHFYACFGCLKNKKKNKILKSVCFDWKYNRLAAPYFPSYICQESFFQQYLHPILFEFVYENRSLKLKVLLGKRKKILKHKYVVWFDVFNKLFAN